MVRKQGNAWCVLHAHPKDPSNPRDKEPGSVIKCYSFDSSKPGSESAAKSKANALHRAIMANKTSGLSQEGIDKIVADVEKDVSFDSLFVPTSKNNVSNKAWSEEAREAAAEARRKGGGGGAQVSEKNILYSTPTPVQKEYYSKVKEMGDRSVRWKVANRKVGVAEAKSRAWKGYAAKAELNSSEHKRCLAIGESYSRAAVKSAVERDKFKVGV